MENYIEPEPSNKTGPGRKEGKLKNVRDVTVREMIILWIVQFANHVKKWNTTMWL